MVVEFPTGTDFQLENKGGKGKRGGGGGLRELIGGDDGVGGGSTSVAMPTRYDIDRSERELARVFVEMFQPLGGEAITVCFNDWDRAEEAKRIWEVRPTG
jgi:hypothetical protein